MQGQVDFGLYLYIYLFIYDATLDELMLIEKQMQQTKKWEVTCHHRGETPGLQTKRHLPEYMDQDP